MSHDNEGKTPAAWTTVLLLMVASAIGGIAVILGNWLLFWIGGGGLAVLALIIGKVMAAAGLGSTPKKSTATVQ